MREYTVFAKANFYIEFLVNKEVFEQYDLELPTDWEKLVTACNTLRENGIVHGLSIPKKGWTILHEYLMPL